MDKVHVRCDACGDFAGPENVKEGDILPDNGPEICAAKTLRQAFTSMEKANGGDVDENEFADGKVHEVDCELRDIGLQRRAGDRAVAEVLESPDQLAIDDLQLQSSHSCKLLRR